MVLLQKGAGENIVASAADFENFLEPRIVLGLMKWKKTWSRYHSIAGKKPLAVSLHATYGESIERELALFEKINKEIPFNGLRWFFDHAETITDNQLQSV